MMALTVEDFHLEVSSSGGDGGDEGLDGHEFISKLPYDFWEGLGERYHLLKRKAIV
ncbi:hypothetical protein BYT27DRAFT_7185119 [Phlegmacium glaucopus]|nr:hypothetical protein BYT27DRAFT_7185119 [Phlegmacium glaucopus]